MTGVPRVRRFPRRPFVRPLDPCKVAAAGMRVFGKRYAQIAHLLDPLVVLRADTLRAAEVLMLSNPRNTIYVAETNNLYTPSPPLPVSQGEPNDHNRERLEQR